jgi:ParB-like chromosome segregation protein Spo0J
MQQIDANDQKRKTGSWRDVLKIHPAADLFPLMSEAELRELGEDIKANGLQVPITVMYERVGNSGEWLYQLLDGRNRLDAIALAGFNTIAPKRSQGRAWRRKNGTDCGLDLSLGLPDGGDIAINYIPPPDDVFAFVNSANAHRRHLKDKHEQIAAVLKAKTELSMRQIGEMVGADHKTVAKVRGKLESTGEISPVEKTTGKDGRARVARKPRDLEKERAAREERKRQARGDIPPLNEIYVEHDRIMAESEALPLPEEVSATEVGRFVSWLIQADKEKAKELHRILCDSDARLRLRDDLDREVSRSPAPADDSRALAEGHAHA